PSRPPVPHRTPPAPKGAARSSRCRPTVSPGLPFPFQKPPESSLSQNTTRLLACQPGDRATSATLRLTSVRMFVGRDVARAPVRAPPGQGRPHGHPLALLWSLNMVSIAPPRLRGTGPPWPDRIRAMRARAGFAAEVGTGHPALRWIGGGLR